MRFTLLLMNYIPADRCNNMCYPKYNEFECEDIGNAINYVIILIDFNVL